MTKGPESCYHFQAGGVERALGRDEEASVPVWGHVRACPDVVGPRPLLPQSRQHEQMDSYLCLLLLLHVSL